MENQNLQKKSKVILAVFAVLVLIASAIFGIVLNMSRHQEATEEEALTMDAEIVSIKKFDENGNLLASEIEADGSQQDEKELNAIAGKETKKLNDDTPVIEHIKARDEIELLLKGVDDKEYKLNSLTKNDIEIWVGNEKQNDVEKTLTFVSESPANGARYNLVLSNITGNGELCVKIAANTLEDAAGNKNAQAIRAVFGVPDNSTTEKIIVDNIKPTVTITADKTSPTNASSITYTFKFSEDVYEFVGNDITVTNGKKGAFSGSGDTYTLVVTNDGTCEQKVSVAAGVCRDIGYNKNLASEVKTMKIDNTAPTVELTKETYQEGFDGWTLPTGASIGNDGVLTISEASSEAYKNYRTGNEPWYATFDAYTSTASETAASDLGQYIGSAGVGEGGVVIYNTMLNSVYEDTHGSLLPDYTEQGIALQLPLNTWSNNFKWDAWKNYGNDIEYEKIRFPTSTVYSKPPLKIRNFKMHGQLYTEFYDIKVKANGTGSDIASAKWLAGNHTAEDFVNAGENVADNTIQVTENGIYTIYVEDEVGNTAVSTIEVTKIDKTAPVIEGANQVNGDSFSFTAKDIAPDGNEAPSGVVGYQITDSATAPTSGWQNVVVPEVQTVDGKQQTSQTVTVTDSGLTAGTHYIWVIDAAGHKTSKQIAVTYELTLNPGANVTTTGTTSVTASGATLPNITAPTKIGYTFEGYYTQENGVGTQYYNADGTPARGNDISANTTLYAKWTANKYHITLDNGRAVTPGTTDVWYYFNTTKKINNVTVYYYSDEACTTPLAGGYYITLPAKTGYAFGGYYSGTNGTGTKYVNNAGGFINNIYANVANDSTLYAKWTANPYTVTLNAGDGTIDAGDDGWTRAGDNKTATKDITYDSDYGILPTASRTGYTFDGWFTEATGGTKITNTTKMQTASEQTLYPHWKAITYKIKFNANGGTGTMADLDMTYDSAKNLTSNAFTKTGYHLKEWTTNADGTGTKFTDGQSVNNLTTTNDATVNLYAQWEANQYTVSFDPNGGTPTPASKSVTYDSTYGTLPSAEDVSKAGYTFKGWRGKNLFETPDNQTRTDLNYTTTIENGKYTLNGQVSDYAPGYVARNMYKLINGANYANYMSYMNISWTPNIVTKMISAGTYTFSINKLSGNTPPKTCYVEIRRYSDGVVIAQIKLHENETSATFTLNEDTEVYYDIYHATNGQVFDNLSFYVQLEQGTTATAYEPYLVTAETKVTTASDHTLKAIWETIPYTISYELNKGTNNSSNPTGYTVESENITLQNPTRNGYTFIGWTGSNGDTPQTTVTIPKGSTGNRTYTANWEEKTYTLTIKPNGGELDGYTTDVVRNLKYSDVSDINTPTKTGYTFNGYSELSGAAFSNGLASVTKYSNKNVGQIIITPQAKSVDNPLSGTADELVISNAGTAQTSPGLGGFYHGKYGSANKEYVHIFVAKLPVGYYFHNAYNSIGTEGTTEWLTSNEGTGEWQTYVYKVNTGSTGEIRNFGYVYVSTYKDNVWKLEGGTYGQTGAYTAYLAYSNIYDITSDDSGIGQIDGTGVLTATYNANNYTIHFNANGGTGEMSDEAMTYDVEKALTKNTFTKTGYEFQGWALSDNGNAEYDDEQVVKNLTTEKNGEVTLYANWKAKEYTVTANANGGTISTAEGWDTTGAQPTKSVTYDSAYGTLPTASRTGYTFKGWNGKNLFNTANIISGKNVAVNEDGSVYATNTNTDNRSWLEASNDCWKTILPAGTYTVSFELKTQTTPVSAAFQVRNNDKNKVISQTSICNVDNAKLTFVLTEQTEIGIMMKLYEGVANVQLEQGSTATPYEPYYITSATPVTTPSNHTLTAIWQANPINLANQSKSVTYSRSSQTITIDGATNGTGNYVYTEVSEKNANNTDTDYISIDGTTITLSASTPAGTYTYGVHARDSESGSEADGTITITVNPYDISGANSEVSEIANETYNGSEHTPEPTVTALDTTLVKDTDYTLSYNNNINVGIAAVTITGTGNFTGSKVVNFTIVKATNPLEVNANTGLIYNTTAQNLVTPANVQGDVYYSFEYINGSNYNTAGSKDIPTGIDAGTYKVYWYTPGNGNYAEKSGNVKVTIGRFDISGGTVEDIPNQNYTGSEICPTPSVTITINGASKVLSSSREIFYRYSININPSDKATIKVLGFRNYTGAIDKYFTINPLITFESNGGSGEMASQHVVYNTNTPLNSNTFTRDYYHFIGWNTDSSATTPIYANGANIKTKDNTTLYAIWEGNPYTVVFDANGGSGEAMANQSFKYGETKALSKNTYTKADGSGTMYVDEEEVSSLTTVNNGTVRLYAQWTKFGFIPETVYLTKTIPTNTATIVPEGSEGKVKFTGKSIGQVIFTSQDTNVVTVTQADGTNPARITTSAGARDGDTTTIKAIDSATNQELAELTVIIDITPPQWLMDFVEIIRRDQ